MRSIVLCGLFLLLFAPPSASASTYYGTHVCEDAIGCDYVIIGFTKYIARGTWTTASTANLGKWLPEQVAIPDTVLRVTGPDNREVAFNDDCPGKGRASCVAFSAPASGLYRFWVHSYSNATVGRTDLIVDGVKVRTQQKFSGAHHFVPTSGGEVVHTVPNNKTPMADGSVRRTDTMVFMIRGDLSLAGWDDDSGPNLHALAPVVEAVDHFLVAYYPDTLTGGSIGLLVDDDRLPDSDADGLSDELEAKLGSNPHSADTDGDGIPDYLEVIGNDGFNYAEQAHVQFPDVFVEIDVMTAPDPNLQRSPPPSLAMDLYRNNPFGPLSTTRFHVFIDDWIPQEEWARYLCNGPCTGLADSADFWELREKFFVSKHPERVPYFKYGIWGHQFADAYYSVPTCASGVAEYPGANFMITLGCVPPSDYDAEKAIGTLLHELGHLLNLDHNGNDHSEATSEVHQSHMNYRYIWKKVPPDHIYWHEPAFRFSLGTMPDASCEVSPKEACVQCRARKACASFPCSACDADRNEALLAEYGHGSQSGWWSYGLEAIFHRPSPDTTKQPRGWSGPQWIEDPVRMRDRARRHAFSKQLNGMRNGVHFRMSPDETRIFSTCGQ